MATKQFADLGLDPRLMRALSKKAYTAPTPVQAEAIPKSLEGRDTVARARTGSGKTMAYLLPALHKLLGSANTSASFQVIVLVPTRELCEQVRQEAHGMAVHCGAGLSVTSLGNETTDHAARIAVSNAGQLVVTTPGRLATALKDKTLPAAHLHEHLQVLILDEADLLLTYGYEDDMHTLAPLIPRTCQCILMSATTSPEVDRLSALVLHDPVSLDLTHLATAAPGGGTAAEIQHFALDVKREDLLMVVMTMVRLNLIKRKALLFVNSVDMAYKLRLLLEAFGQRAAVLNAEMPLNSRHHIIQQFNRDLFDLLIATDTAHARESNPKAAPSRAARSGGAAAPSRNGASGSEDEGAGSDDGAAAAAGGEGAKSGKRGREADDKKAGGKARKGGKKRGSDEAEFGVTRGVDFKGVRTVINVELPGGVQGYTHRVGRTGRAGHSGYAITLFTPQDAPFRAQLQQSLQDAAASAAGPAADEDDAEVALKPFVKLKPDAVQSLRYRAEDVLRSLTKSVIREARAKDLKMEMLNSSRLQEFFETHESDAYVLKHDKQLARDPQKQRHLRHLPEYIKESAGVQTAGRKTAGNAVRGIKRKLRPDDDPLKGKAKFTKSDELTEIEKKAIKLGKKDERKRAKNAVLPMVPKQNVRKRRG